MVFGAPFYAWIGAFLEVIMAKIVFDALHVPVPKHLLGRLKVFSGGNLGVNGVRVTCIGTKAFFHVLSWEDVEVLHGLNVNMGDYVDVFKRHNPCHNNILLIRRVQYLSKSLNRGANHAI